VGRAKEWMMEQEERGYGYVEGNVCADCFLEESLKQRITLSANSTKCDYCGNISPENIAASFDEIVGVIYRGISHDWNDPNDEGIMYVSADGGYQAQLTDTRELLYDVSENEQICNAICEKIFTEAWVEREFYIGSSEKRMMRGWDQFSDAVRHHTRFLFLHPNNNDVDWEITPANFLNELANDINQANGKEHDLVKTLPIDVAIFRVRMGNQPHFSVSEIGTAPQEKAIYSNRMSPSGIPMFYGAFCEDTALKEANVSTADNSIASIGTFYPVRPLKFLDLGKLPAIPSVFDDQKRHLIRSLRFLHYFAKGIAKPVAHDRHEHIEYVPTQIVTEFFRRIYRTENQQKLDGIIYKSSRDHGKFSCVIFCEQEQCIENEDVDTQKEPLLKMKHVKQKPQV
jgi:hypothetical protein